MQTPRLRSTVRLALGTLWVVLAVGCAGSWTSLPWEPQRGLDRVLATGELRVGMTGEQAPLNLHTSTGEWIGIEVAIVRSLARNLGVESRIVQLPFGRLLDALEAGEIDIVASGMTITPRRNARAAFVGPYFVSGKAILTRDASLLAQSLAELNRPGLRVAALAGSTSEEFVKRNLPQATLATTETTTAAVQRLVDGGADAVVADYESCAVAVLRRPEAGLHMSPARLTVEPMGIAVPPGDQLLANLLQNYLTALRITGGLDRIHQLWLANDAWLQRLGPPPQATPPPGSRS